VCFRLILWQIAQMDTLEKLYAICRGLNRRFANENAPFEIMTRLLEESGELAEQVNLFEGRGVKRDKHGEPDKAKMAREVQDVMRCALQTAMYYGIEQELEVSIEKAYQRVKVEGLVKENAAHAE
jgi:NTP pyrophosphatase (non-canonical NTP hydrolase)